MSLATTPGRPPLRVAFYGRVASDSDDTELSLARQYEQCLRALPPGSISAVFCEVGPSETGSKPAFDRITVRAGYARRGGGLDHLLAEAFREDRRFDYLTASDPFRLSRNSGRTNELLRRLRSVSVRPLVPLGYATAYTTDAVNPLLSAIPAVDRAGITPRAGAR